MRRTRGFTLIELMIVVAIIAIIASVAIPRLMAARLSANESAAISTLRSLSSAQAQLQSSSAIDSDADGGGEYGYFGELSGTAALRIFAPGAGGAPGAPALGAANDLLNPPVLSTAFGQVISDVNNEGVVVRSGYVFKIYLPDVTGGGGLTPGLPEAGAAAGPNGADGGSLAALPDPNNSEVLWCCYAWPLNAGQTGNRTFFINQEGDLLQMANRQGQYSGTTVAANIPVFSAAYSAADMASPLGINGVVAVDTFLWTPVQ